MAQQYSLQWLRKKYDEDEPLKYIFFWGHQHKKGEETGKFCFSQWYESPFNVDGITYRSTEHWMMAKKALLFNDLAAFNKIIHCIKPAEAKSIGREITGFDDALWDAYKYEIVKEGNIHKFGQQPELKTFLLGTGNRVLAEASPVDIVWGIGLAQDHEHINDPHYWRGENLLGFALMEVRDILRKEAQAK